MADSVIPDDVKQFLLRYIDSIAQLEGLLMFRADLQKEWNAEMIARGLFIDEAQAAVLLARLSEQGFLSAPEKSLSLHYRYQPKSPEWADMVERLAELYKNYLVPITNLIHAKSKTRIQEFADAFKLRKD